MNSTQSKRREASAAAKSLLQPGERLEPLDLEGWIVLKNQLKMDDQIVIDWPKNHDPNLFDRPVRAIVDGVSSVNTVALNILTAGAKDHYGTEWSVGPAFGWMDCMWHTWKVVLDQP